MATFTFFDEFKKYLGDGTIDLDTHTFKAVLTNSAPTAGTNTVLADITQIANGNGYTTGGNTLGTVTWAETGGGTGIWQFTSADSVWTASGGSIATFRYVVVYDDTPTSPADPLVGYLDYGSGVTITTGNTFTVDVGANGWFRLS
jgi:hypothetical protein